MTRLSVTERRTRLRAAAWQVLVDHGAAGATTRAICAAAGMPQSAFHYCFSSRDELLTELVSELLPRELAAAASTVDRSGSTAEALHRALLAYWEMVEAEPGVHQVIHEITAASLRDPGLARLSRVRYDRYQEAVRAVLADISAARGLSWDREPGEVALHIVSLLNGLTLQFLLDHDSEAARAVLQSFARSLADHARPLRSVPIRGAAR